MSRFVSRVCGRGRACVIAAAVGVGALATAAQAQFTPPDLDPIVLPVSQASIVEAVLVAGASILVAAFGVSIGFMLVRKLKARVTRAV